LPLSSFCFPLDEATYKPRYYAQYLYNENKSLGDVRTP
jgi:hypothetical protein